LSTKRDKFLESAQKFIAKGQIDRAIKDYEQVVALDPSDIRHRQRLAELLVRASRTIEAIGEYEAIGKYYADNGFYLKAIAVYKQVQKLDPDDIKTSINLASLNEKQGLTGNALAEYGKVYSFFEKSGKLSDALRILESMITLDPENLATRLKYAETRYSLGQKGDAYEEFRQTAILLRGRGDEVAYGQVAERIGHLYPDKKDFSLELLSAEIENGNAPLAVSLLQELTEKDQHNLKAWNLLLDAYRAAGTETDYRDALQRMLPIFPDDPGIKERLMQSALEDGDVDGGLALLDEYGDLFVSRGELQLLERIYRGLLDGSPHDSRLLEGLAKLYEAGGDEEKLKEMVERLDSLNQLRPRTDEEPGDGYSSGPLTETVFPADVPDEQEDGDESNPPSFANGSDAVPDIVGTEWHPEHATAEDAIVTSEVESGSDSLDGFDFPMEVDLELEFSEDELAELPPPYGEGAEDTETVPGEDDARERGAASAPLSREVTEGSVPDEGFLSGEPFEVTVDSLFAPEAGWEEESGRGAAQEKQGPDRSFSGFKKGLDEQLEQGDTETRYNLGIAFKEMGLYDEAITEFEAAASDPRRWIDCLTLQGICCRDKGDVDRAEDIFKKGLAQEGLSDEEYLSITYELALLYESAGRTEDALVTYLLIQERQEEFRETKSKIARLQGGEEPDALELVELEHDDLV
jgi:tetratricopeptide (TPR) repeat protein